jgi:hypothetical protein
MVPTRGHGGEATLPDMVVYLFFTGKEQAQLSYATTVCSSFSGHARAALSVVDINRNGNIT